MDAGDPGDGDTFVALGTGANLVANLSVAPGVDQFTSIAGDQLDFQHVDAKALEGGALNARGNALNNNFAGTALADTLIGGAGSDTLSLGLLDLLTDIVVYETKGDGVNSLHAPTSFDRIKEFEAGRDELSFRDEFNTVGSQYDLDDIGTANDQFVFATDVKANFSATHEALFLSAAKSKVIGETPLTAFKSVIAAINKVGVIAGAGDDGLIVIQSTTRAGFYYYQESDGIANAISAGELTLLGIIEAQATKDDFSFG